jgi:hypothetical protein
MRLTQQLTRHGKSRNISKIAKLSLLLLATLVLSSVYYSPHSVQGTSFTRFPSQHADLLSADSYNSVFGAHSALASPSDSTGVGASVTVGPNVRVNNPQVPAPNGLIGRSETTIAVGQNGQRMVAGWNHADGFLRRPFTTTPIPGNPGLSGYAFSTNGGNTWTDAGTPPLFPATTSFFSGNVVTRGDPWLAVAPFGGTETFYYANLAVFEQRDSFNSIVDAGVSIHRGTFTGSSFSWNGASRLLPAPNAPFDFYDKEAIAARQVNGVSMVVVSVTNFIGISTPGTDPASCQFAGGFGQIEVWVSTDGGNTFQAPLVVGPDETNTAADPFCNTGRLNQGSMPFIGADGSVYVTWTRGPRFVNGVVPDDSTEDIVAVTSQDGGHTFSNLGIVRTIVPGRQNPPVGFNRNRYNDFPRITASDSGRIFVALQDAKVAGNQGIGGNDSICLQATGLPSPGESCGDPSLRRVMVGGGADMDVYLSYSDDQGAHWSTPNLVNPVAGDDKIQFWPVVNIGTRGEVNVVYYESREFHLSSDPLAIDCTVSIGGGLARRSLRASLVDTFFAQSLDGGRTFQTPVKVSTVTSNWCDTFSNIRPNFGDYIDARTVGSTTFAVWADSRNTVTISGTPRHIPDVFYASIQTTF